MSKNCQKCNAEMAEEMNFCPECRTKWVSPTSNSTSQNVYTEPNEKGQIASNLTFWQKLRQPRMSVLDYWVVLIGFQACFWVCYGVIAYLLGLISPMASLIALPILLIPLAIVVIYLQARRLHDLGKSAWFVLFALIPFIGALGLIVFYFFPGNKERNKYGEVPQRIFFNK